MFRRTSIVVPDKRQDKYKRQALFTSFMAEKSIAFYTMQARERTLSQIIEEGYKYVIAVNGIRPSPVEGKFHGGYQLFKELDLGAIEEHAKDVARQNNIQLTSIEYYSLNSRLQNTITLGK
jgi:hypothetical protein